MKIVRKKEDKMNTFDKRFLNEIQHIVLTFESYSNVRYQRFPKSSHKMGRLLFMVFITPHINFPKIVKSYSTL